MMAYNWKILKAAVEQEILFPSKESFDACLQRLIQRNEPFQVLNAVQNEDGTVTVLMRKRYNPQNAFLWSQEAALYKHGKED